MDVFPRPVISITSSIRISRSAEGCIGPFTDKRLFEIGRAGFFKQSPRNSITFCISCGLICAEPLWHPCNTNADIWPSKFSNSMAQETRFRRVLVLMLPPRRESLLLYRWCRERGDCGHSPIDRLTRLFCKPEIVLHHLL